MAQRATSLGPKPSLFCCFFSFPFFAFTRKNRFSPLKRAFLLLFECLPLLFLSLFGLPLFHFLFLCLSLVFFFPSCLSLFVFFWFLFVSFFFCLSSLLLLHEKNNMKLLNLKVLFINPFSFFGFLSCFLI